MNTSFVREVALLVVLNRGRSACPSGRRAWQMLVDEADAALGELAGAWAGIWVLTNLAAGLTYEGGCRDTDANNFQGITIMTRTPKCYTGARTPLGAIGYASESDIL